MVDVTVMETVGNLILFIIQSKNMISVTEFFVKR